MTYNHAINRATNNKLKVYSYVVGEINYIVV